MVYLLETRVSLIYITYGGADYEETTEKIDTACHAQNIDFTCYDDLWLRKQDFFYTFGNQWLWKTEWKRGDGWFAWKPYIIMDALSKADHGDVILYTDADTYPVGRIDSFREISDQRLFQAGDYQNRQWCKRDCSIVMGQDDDKYLDAPAGNAAVCAFRKGSWSTQQFLAEWLTYAVNPKANTLDESTIAPEKPGFIEHRAEQAILTMLAHKYGFKLWRDPSQHGEGIDRDRDVYGQLFEHVEGMTKAPSEPRGSKWRNV